MKNVTVIERRKYDLIVFVQIPFAGKKLKIGKKFAQVESGKWLGKVYAPVECFTE